MPIRRKWRLGDHLCRCDKTGFTRYASETKLEWNGDRVWNRVWWARNPQDFVRGLRDEVYVDDARPRGTDVFTGPLTTSLTADHVAGNQSLAVTSSARFEGGDNVLIGMTNNQMFAGLVQSIPDATTLVLTEGLSWAAATGATVVNRTAVASSDIA